jgi:outer membrane receptor protein involved in Fe transport
MCKTLAALCAPLTLASAFAADAVQPASEGETVQLETLTVFSSRVALQEPAATYAAPVSALRYEPQVDVQSRNFAEGQADVTIRGGTFENTGFSVGALPIYDPQTGHYSAELPVSPHMLGAPEIRTGAGQATSGFNATAGGVAYGWRPVRAGGAVSGATGNDDLARGELHAGVVAPEKLGGFTVGADFSVAQAKGDGPRKWTESTVPAIVPDPAERGRERESDFEFGRVNGRVQFSSEVSQTDLFAGYQSKHLAWPNLYAARTPLIPLRYEEENIETKLFVLNHRTLLGADGDFIQAGAYYRGNKDFFDIPAFGAGGETRHKTLVRGAAFDGRETVLPGTALLYGGGLVADKIDSSALFVGPTNGRFRTRTHTYATLTAEHTRALDEDRDLVLSAGARHDDSNRDPAEISPLASVELRQREGVLRRAYVSYAESTQLPNYQALNASSTGGLFRGNRDLERATAQNFELGAELAVESWTLQSAVFFRRDRDLLDYVFDPVDLAVPPSTRFARNVDVDTFGVEFFARRSWDRFDLFAGYTYLHKNDDYANPDVASFYALNYAEHRLTLGGVARLGGGFELRADNELRRQADNALRQNGRDNLDTALGLFYSVPGVKGLVLNAQVENLWDSDYQDVPLVPHTPRTWSVGANYVW